MIRVQIDVSLVSIYYKIKIIRTKSVYYDLVSIEIKFLKFDQLGQRWYIDSHENRRMRNIRIPYSALLVFTRHRSRVKASQMPLREIHVAEEKKNLGRWRKEERMAKKWPPLFSLPPPYFIHTALRVHRRPLRLPGMFHRPINFDPLPRKQSYPYSNLTFPFVSQLLLRVTI